MSGLVSSHRKRCTSTVIGHEYIGVYCPKTVCLTFIWKSAMSRLWLDFRNNAYAEILSSQRKVRSCFDRKDLKVLLEADLKFDELRRSKKQTP